MLERPLSFRNGLLELGTLNGRVGLRSNVQIFMAETVCDEPDAPEQSEGSLYRAGFKLSHLRVQYVPA
jgi:hypothetical protein